MACQPATAGGDTVPTEVSSVGTFVLPNSVYLVINKISGRAVNIDSAEYISEEMILFTVY